jgi:hypothetical protein
MASNYFIYGLLAAILFFFKRYHLILVLTTPFNPILWHNGTFINKQINN